jgi:hypothetical protein
MELTISKPEPITAIPVEHLALATILYDLNKSSAESADHPSILAWLNSVSFTQSDLIEAYENILLEFPTGFYAQLVRQRLEFFKSTPL